MSKRKVAASSASAAAASYQFGAPAFGASTASSSLSHIAEPLDFSTISEPSVVVLFKNLTKRDALTKERALQELQTVLSREGELEEGILAAWVHLYPRLSIENARQVRLLSHQILGAVAQKSKKRFLPHMPKVVGCWLAGLYDGDKLVAQGAANSMRHAFQSEEKVALLWKAYQGAILDFCSSAVLNETPNSLSDERNNSPDEMETKYVRVISGGMMAISHLISALKDETHKQDEAYSLFVNDPRPWTFASSKESSLRLALYGLLRSLLLNRKDLIGSALPTISTAMITKASSESQAGSSLDYLVTLIYLTQSFPECWELAATKKISPLSLLRRYIRRGAQGASQTFWERLSELLQQLPSSVYPEDLKHAQELLKAVLEGVRNAFGEHRANNAAAWRFFFVSCRYLMNKLSIDGLQKEILHEWVAKVLDTNIDHDASKDPKFQIAGDTVAILADGMQIIALSDDNEPFRAEFESLWNLVSEKISSKIVKQSHEPKSEADTDQKMSVMEKKQHLEKIEQWIGLTSRLYLKFPEGSWQSELVQRSEVMLLERAVAAAGESNEETAKTVVVTLLCLSKSAAALKKHDRSREIMRTYVVSTVPLILSKEWNEAAFRTLVNYGILWADEQNFSTAWRATIINLLEKEDRNHLLLALRASSIPEFKSIPPSLPELENHIRETVVVERNSNKLSSELLKAALDASGCVVSVEFGMEILSSLVSGISVEAKEESLIYARNVCQLLLDVHSSVLLAFAQSAQSTSFKMTAQLPKLLALMESPQEDVATIAEAAYKKVQGVINASNSGGSGILLDALKKSVQERTGDSWLSIESLASGAEDLIEEMDERQAHECVKNILFSSDDWDSALRSLYSVSPKASSAYLHPLGSCACLVEESKDVYPASEFDDEGLPLAVRMGLFTVRLFETLEPSLQKKVDDEADIAHDLDNMQLEEKNNPFKKLANQNKMTLLKSLLILYETSNDMLLFSRGNSDVNAETIRPRWDLMENLVGSLDRALILLVIACSDNWDAIFSSENGIDADPEDSTAGAVLHEFTAKLESGHRNSESFYFSRALANLLGKLRTYTEETGSNGTLWIEKNKMRRSKNVFLNTALLTGYGSDDFRSSTAAVKLRNELINDVSGVSTKSAPVDGLEKLLLLNELLPSDSDEKRLNIPEQRLIFFVRQLLSWFDQPDFEFASENPGLLCEVARSLKLIAIPMRMVHGGHWQLIFKLLSDGFEIASTTENYGSIINISLFKLFDILKEAKAINQEEGDINDDLNDEWDEALPTLYQRWLTMLKTSHESDREKPILRMSNSTLARNLSKIPLKFIDDAEDYYEILGVESTAIQGAAFSILHRYIPTQQEQLSIDAALSQDEEFVVQLPPEVLSLILEVPNAMNSSAVPYSEIRRYLLSWLLVFDHFKESSFKVKAAYVENLKEGSYVKPLLDFIFDQLGHSRGKPVDGSKYDINDYTLELEVSPSSEKYDCESLMVHLYYLSLRFTPSLAKTWYNECRNRQTITNVEAFTERFISPLLIQVELEAVMKWLDDPTNSPEGLNVSVNRTVREVKTMYDVDEQQMEMMVKLPTSFPLKLVEVKGIKRVAVTESQWRNWLLACQAVIALQSGSIVDGLMLFQRNVKLHLDGVEECAICYSILSTVERTLPTKGCGTCKKKFHGSCLMRWFKTSSSSSCPLCRNSFQFL